MYEIYSFKYSDEIKKNSCCYFQLHISENSEIPDHCCTYALSSEDTAYSKHVTIHIRKFVVNAMASPVFLMSYRKQLVAMRLTSLIMTRKMTFNIQLQRYLNQNINSIFDLYRNHYVPSCRVTKYGMISGL